MQPHPPLPERSPPLVANQLRARVVGHNPVEATGVPVRVVGDEDQIDVAGHAGLSVCVRANQRQR